MAVGRVSGSRNEDIVTVTPVCSIRLVRDEKVRPRRAALSPLRSQNEKMLKPFRAPSRACSFIFRIQSRD